MGNNPYLVLMLSDSASEEEINEAYQRLKKEYSEDRFLEGDAGYIAAKKLTELEQAYGDIQVVLHAKQAAQSFGSIYGEIEQFIKDNRLAEAQEKLDNISDRAAEWHFLQSILFYRKNWQSESKKQLEIAVALDPSNAKYQEALVKLKNITEAKPGAVPAPSNYGANQPPQQTQSNMPMDSQMGGTTNCCLNLLCADCCCECMGGDLIPCC